MIGNLCFSFVGLDQMEVARMTPKKETKTKAKKKKTTKIQNK